MLYLFIKLSQKLTALGYPEVSDTGFRVIKRDLSQEELAGNVEFREDGIYLTADGQEYKGYMYLKFPNVYRFGMPKFHITNCQTVLEQRISGRFSGRYFWHNSNTVNIEDRTSGQVHENVNLTLCNYCRNQALVGEYSDTQGFFSLLDDKDQEDINQEYEVDIFGYTLDWQKISYKFRKEKEFTCENCGIQIEEIIDRRFIHVHHKSGNKLNNRRTNLECLCVLCHAHKDPHHERNFGKGRMQAFVTSFVVKYRKKLIELKNEFLIREDDVKRRDSQQ
jgi:hypothetical protein